MSTTQTTTTKPDPIAGWLDMSIEERAAWLRENGKSYLSQAEQAEWLRIGEGRIQRVYLAEADRARDADDDDAFCGWFSLVQPPAHSLAVMKKWYGADYIRKWGFDTSKADHAYGPGWLEK